VRKFIAIACAGLLFAALVPAPAPGYAASAAEAEAAVRVAVRMLRLQTELPEGSAIREENKRQPPSGRPDGSSLILSPDTARILFWIAVAIIIATILMSLRDNLWSFSRSRNLRRDEEGEGASAGVTARLDMARGTADELALHGSFAEAMHALLLHSVSELRRRLDITIAASLTSREILQRVALPSEGRAAFAAIIAMVEISYFGAHEPGETEYKTCRESFETLAAVLRRERAA
jgi:hypothetical protein